ncbi:MAG: HAD hydrolase family protein, partial [Oscillospiraceae bacterium]|nr:HAD hydrolase family protein [Oscillospiraceae bacterium]
MKAIFIDIDRTLTNSKKQVTLENSIAIKKAIEKGIYVVLCSGRGIGYATKKSKEANASEY